MATLEREETEESLFESLPEAPTHTPEVKQRSPEQAEVKDNEHKQLIDVEPPVFDVPAERNTLRNLYCGAEEQGGEQHLESRDCPHYQLSV